MHARAPCAAWPMDVTNLSCARMTQIHRIKSLIRVVSWWNLACARTNGQYIKIIYKYWYSARSCCNLVKCICQWLNLKMLRWKRHQLFFTACGVFSTFSWLKVHLLFSVLFSNSQLIINIKELLWTILYSRPPHAIPPLSGLAKKRLYWKTAVKGGNHI